MNKSIIFIFLIILSANTFAECETTVDKINRFDATYNILENGNAEVTFVLVANFPENCLIDRYKKDFNLGDNEEISIQIPYQDFICPKEFILDNITTEFGNFPNGIECSASFTSDRNNIRMNFTGVSSFLGEKSLDKTIVRIGGITGMNNGGIVSFSYNTGDVTSIGIFGTGGIAGSNAGLVNNVYNTGNIYAPNSDYVGGIFGAHGLYDGDGYNIVMDLNEIYNSGNVTGKDYVGGLIGQSTQLNINRSYNIGNVNGNSMIAGFVGMISSNTIISDSYNSGNISGNSSVSAIIYDFGKIDITNSYNSGNISSPYSFVGNEAGSNSLIKNSFNVGTASGSPNYFIYYYTQSLENNFTTTTNCVEAGETYDTSECAVNQSATDFYLTNHAVYNGTPAWDFTNVWQARDNNYPILKWQN